MKLQVASLTIKLWVASYELNLKLRFSKNFAESNFEFVTETFAGY